jgi:hypothetical protein
MLKGQKLQGIYTVRDPSGLVHEIITLTLPPCCTIIGTGKGSPRIPQGAQQDRRVPYLRCRLPHFVGEHGRPRALQQVVTKE